MTTKQRIAQQIQVVSSEPCMICYIRIGDHSLVELVNCFELTERRIERGIDGSA